MPDVPSHLRTLTAQFSTAAGTYHRHADVQRRVALELVSSIPGDCFPDRILELGCGSGQLTEHLLEAYPKASITALDISSSMVSEAQRRLGHTVTWSIADLSQVDVSPRFPMVASSSSIHWCHPLEDAFGNIRRLVSDDGLLILSIMVDGTLRELRQARERVAPHKPIESLPQTSSVLDVLETSGFAIEKEWERDLPRTYSSGTAFLQSLKAQGLTGGRLARSEVPLTRNELLSVVKHLETDALDEQGQVVAHFCPLFVIARPTA